MRTPRWQADNGRESTTQPAPRHWTLPPLSLACARDAGQLAEGGVDVDAALQRGADGGGACRGRHAGVPGGSVGSVGELGGQRQHGLRAVQGRGWCGDVSSTLQGAHVQFFQHSAASTAGAPVLGGGGGLGRQRQRHATPTSTPPARANLQDIQGAVLPHLLQRSGARRVGVVRGARQHGQRAGGQSQVDFAVAARGGGSGREEATVTGWTRVKPQMRLRDD